MIIDIQDFRRQKDVRQQKTNRRITSHSAAGFPSFRTDSSTISGRSCGVRLISVVVGAVSGVRFTDNLRRSFLNYTVCEMTTNQDFVRLYVGRIPASMSREQMEDLFSKHGALLKVDLKQGYGFVDFSDLAGAESAIAALNGYELDGSRLHVERSRKADSERGTRCFNCGRDGHWYCASFRNSSLDFCRTLC